MDRAIASWRRACPKKGPFDPGACKKLGRRLWALGKRDDALACFVKSCNLLGDGCSDAASIAREQVMTKLHGQCQAGDGVACEELAPRLLERGCRRGKERSCKRLERDHAVRARAFWARQCAMVRFDPKSKPCQEHLRLGGKLPPPTKKKAR
jgi:hypothetical protein